MTKLQKIIQNTDLGSQASLFWSYQVMFVGRVILALHRPGSCLELPIGKLFAGMCLKYCVSPEHKGLSWPSAGIFSLGPLWIYRRKSLRRVGGCIDLKEWSTVHWKYSQLMHNNLGVRATAQEIPLLREGFQTHISNPAKRGFTVCKYT